MLDIYWWLLWISLGFAIISLFLGDILDGFMDSIFDSIGDFFSPLLLFGSLSVVSGSGVLFTKYSELSVFYVLLISLCIGLGAYILIYYFLVIPMSNAEASSSSSVNDLVGKVGEVITTIPAQGLGEVFIESPSGSRNDTAASFDKVELKQGATIVVVQVKDQILHVSKLEKL